ncbi:MAG: S8 family serine peptidase [Alphaproteobacteria bacterium]|nr:S8 family serine peptidase [Alphaproteobacteria bacterium]
MDELARLNDDPLAEIDGKLAAGDAVTVKLPQCLRYEGPRYVVKRGDTLTTLAQGMGLLDPAKVKFPQYVIDALVDSLMLLNPSLKPTRDPASPLDLTLGLNLRLPITTDPTSTTLRLLTTRREEKERFAQELNARLNPAVVYDQKQAPHTRREDAAANLYAYLRLSTGSYRLATEFAEVPTAQVCPGGAFDPKQDDSKTIALSTAALTELLKYLDQPYVRGLIRPPPGRRYSRETTIGVVDAGVRKDDLPAELLDTWPNESSFVDNNQNDVPNEQGGGSNSRDTDFSPVNDCRNVAAAGNNATCAEHGTHVTGLALGGPAANKAFHEKLRQLLGTEVPAIRYGHFRVVRYDGRADVFSTYAGIKWFQPNANVSLREPSRARVINASVLDKCTSEKSDQLKAILGRSSLIVAAAGNSTTQLPRHKVDNEELLCPALLGGNDSVVVTVGAVLKNGNLAPFSSYGTGIVDMLAPGECVPSWVGSGQQKRLSGTSMAAPQVSFVAALLYALLPETEAQKGAARLVRKQLIASARYDKALAEAALSAGPVDVVRAARIFDDQIIEDGGKDKKSQEWFGKISDNASSYDTPLCKGRDLKLSEMDKVAIVEIRATEVSARVLRSSSDNRLAFEECVIPSTYQIDFQTRNPDGSYGEMRTIPIAKVKEIVPRLVKP